MRVLVSLMLLPTAVLAESAPELAVDPLSSPYLVKLTGGLIAVLLLVFVFAWLVKKLNLNQHSHNGLIRIVAGISIGARDRIVLLEVGKEQILIGLTPGRIEKLHCLSEPLESSESTPVNASFAARLNQIMGKQEGG